MAEDGGAVRLFLVDDQQLVRARFRMVLDAQPDMVVVGEAGDGLEALEQVPATGADVCSPPSGPCTTARR